MTDLRNNIWEEEQDFPQPKHTPINSEADRVVQIVINAVNGSVDAFGKLYIAYVEKIYRYIFYHVMNKSMAEDITEDTFIKAWKAIGSCRGREKTFSSWLYRIAHNQMVDELRRNKRGLFVDIDTIEIIGSAERDLERRLEKQELLMVLDCLSPQQRQVITLKFIEDLKNDEISIITGKSQEAIRVLQMRALSKLRKELSKRY
ncbi:RNA polymerase sigma factor [Chloroflexota bacterium]